MKEAAKKAEGALKQAAPYPGPVDTAKEATGYLQCCLQILYALRMCFDPQVYAGGCNGALFS